MEEIVELSNLKSQISEAARKGRSIHTKIQACRGDARHALWNEKRALGRRARYLLLAYGYLRGIPYRRIEPRCHRDNDAQAHPLIDALALLAARTRTQDRAMPENVQRDELLRLCRELQSPVTGWLRGVAAVQGTPMTEARS